MAAPTPQSESVELANEALNLPLEAGVRRRQLYWRLSSLIRRSPNDEAARIGFLFVAFHSGDRDSAVEQLRWLASRYRALDTRALTNLVGPLVMVGDMQAATNVLCEMLGRHDFAHVSVSRASLVIWALLAGDVDIARQIASGDEQATDICDFVSTDDLVPAIAILGQCLGETIGRKACLSEVDTKLNNWGLGSVLYCAYRVPGDQDERRNLLRAFRRLWRQRLAAAGLSELDYIGILTADVLPMPAQTTAAA